MKFKKIEIQAFRAYDKVEDATFNFELRKDDYADFVSIYAPNGFGKTSFYDAVEWGVTKNIHRFLKKNKFNADFAKSEKIHNKVYDSSNQYILRNKYSSEDLNAYVKLTTTNPEVIGFSLEKPRKGSADYKFENKNTQRNYFQEVILSQEWIDAFLKEDYPSERYDTFIDYFGDKQVAEYYKNLIALINTNDEAIAELIQESKGLQLNLAFEGDQNVLKNINAVIERLNKNGQKLNLIQTTITDSELLYLETIAADQILKGTAQIQLNNDLIQNIEQAFVRSGERFGLEEYFQTRQKNIDSNSRIDALRKALEKKNILTVLGKDKRDYEARTKYKLDEIKEIEELNKFFSEHSEIKKQIDELNKKIEVEVKVLLTYQDSKTETQSAVNLANSQLNRLKESKAKLQELLDKIPGYRTNIVEYAKDRTMAQQELDRSQANATAERIKSEGIKRSLTRLQSFDTTIPDEVQLLSRISDFPEFKAILDELLRLYKRNNDVLQAVSEINARIEESQNFEQEFSDLISTGIIIVNKTKQSNCPLCNNDYQTFDNLVSKITTNNIFSERLKELFTEKSTFEGQLNEIDISIKATINTLQQALQTATNKEKKDLDEANRLLTTANEIVKQKESELNVIQKKLSDISALLEFKPIDEFEADLKNRITGLDEEIRIANESLAKASTSLSEASSKLETSEKDLENLRQRQSTYPSNKAYSLITDYFLNKLQTQEEPTLERLLESKGKHEKEVEELNLKVKDLNARIESLETELKDFDFDIPATITSIEEAVLDLRNDIQLYEQFIKSQLSIDVIFDDLTSATTKLNKLRDQSKSNISLSQTLMQDFNLLNELKRIVLPYLQFEQAKARTSEINERLELLQGPVKKLLSEEREKVTSHLEEMINSFFYEEVINTIYRKIDPHPNYKKIKFKCDFTEDKPQLNVFVGDLTGEVLLIPNLYFSTAQLNILSLSIFLAKALHAKDDKLNSLECIFIDDPIQSMDSINILSTIDLLRSIVVNQGKQIILSTHDENFHELLKKKMPSTLFKSKFMELETFGKVRPEAVQN